MARDDLEHVIEKHFCEAVSAAGGIQFKLRTPGKDGAPDRMAMFPFNRVFFVELKRPTGGRVRYLQHEWAKLALTMGINVEFLWTTQDVDCWIKQVVKA